MTDSEPNFGIRIAGNTQIPALLAIRAKGYALTKWFTFGVDGSLEPQYEAEKGGRCFSATTPEELVGLIAMWEVRGDDWKWRSEEPDPLRKLDAAAVIYDSQGNVVDDSQAAEE